MARSRRKGNVTIAPLGEFEVSLEIEPVVPRDAAPGVYPIDIVVELDHDDGGPVEVEQVLIAGSAVVSKAGRFVHFDLIYPAETPAGHLQRRVAKENKLVIVDQTKYERETSTLPAE